ncbi:DUF6355 family natural product biosynthesis protein [Arthrobacter sp. ATA002]|uniref:DUF6355 family natural product biosynthesis protein n=1 Tax=Arthrobacter sp. ATA002 TaxID=2991715 RepID=UPI003FA48754
MSGGHRKIVQFATTGLLMAGFIAVPAVAHAATPCGWQADEKWYSSPCAEAGTYFHCTDSNTPVKIHIEHTYASREMCVAPRETRLYADPSIGALKNVWAIGAC